jgi:hypothetical protein
LKPIAEALAIWADETAQTVAHTQLAAAFCYTRARWPTRT